jgi:hypothetical protein
VRVKVVGCQVYVLDALEAEMTRRSERPGLTWIEPEREAVAVAANQWAEAHGYPVRVTVDDVERVEVRAVGHSDYARKLALYVAELIAAPPTMQRKEP